MRPNNTYTSPEHRFFFPANGEVEHHESLDTDGLPGFEMIGGDEHYAVIVNSKGEKYGVELYWENYNIPVGARVDSVRAVNSNSSSGIRGGYVEDVSSGVFDEDHTYPKGPDEDLLVIVQADLSRIYSRHDADDLVKKKGMMILPIGTPMPEIGDQSQEEEGRYRLLGFINPEDKFVTWHGTRSFDTLLIDWSVANVVQANRLEQALLHDGLPLGGDLVGILSTRPGPLAYLQYFDDKHGTQYTPTEDPRRIIFNKEEKFPPLTSRERILWTRLSHLADVRGKLGESEGITFVDLKRHLQRLETSGWDVEGYMYDDANLRFSRSPGKLAIGPLEAHMRLATSQLLIGFKVNMTDVGSSPAKINYEGPVVENLGETLEQIIGLGELLDERQAVALARKDLLPGAERVLETLLRTSTRGQQVVHQEATQGFDAGMVSKALLRHALPTQYLNEIHDYQAVELLETIFAVGAIRRSELEASENSQQVQKDRLDNILFGITTAATILRDNLISSE